MKKIGFFGGTFDPIHFGHINLALELMEKASLDEVLFCPTARSPFKANHPPAASTEARLAMTTLAIENVPGFKLCLLEIDRGGISYTIDTLRALKEQVKAELYLLLSAEAIPSFHQWKEYSDIPRLAHLLIGTRDLMPKIPSSPVHDILQKSLIGTRRMEISSTEIRERLKKRLYCGHLMPAQVLDFIKKNNIYS